MGGCSSFEMEGSGFNTEGLQVRVWCTSSSGPASVRGLENSAAVHASCGKGLTEKVSGDVRNDYAICSAKAFKHLANCYGLEPPVDAPHGLKFCVDAPSRLQI